LEIRPVAVADHLAFVTEMSGSFLQTPAWATVKSEWQHERLGWYDGGTLVGTGLVLMRPTPRLRRYFAYLPEGPVVDWTRYAVADVVQPLLGHLRPRRVFTVKIGPQAVVRRWTAGTVKDAVAAGGAARLSDIPADENVAVGAQVVEQLRTAGWRQDSGGAGFGDVQPRYVFQVPLAGRDLDDLRAGLNQLWRRNIRKATKDGVAVDLGCADDLAAFHELYVETARRDGFTPRPLAYFRLMWEAMRAEDPDRIRLYLARRGDQLLAATTWVHVGGRVWYSYGASSTAGREHRGSNAVQWRMLADASAAGASVYDLRGISDTLDAGDPLFGLIQFKLGTGGHAVEYAGEWDYPISPMLHRAFQVYLSRRSP
jgi:lipid II:glycine glycyltransferase (peptidoglycan interpeptide bridge formation enzyme)